MFNKELGCPYHAVTKMDIGFSLYHKVVCTHFYYRLQQSLSYISFVLIRLLLILTFLYSGFELITVSDWQWETEITQWYTSFGLLVYEHLIAIKHYTSLKRIVVTACPKYEGKTNCWKKRVQLKVARKYRLAHERKPHVIFPFVQNSINYFLQKMTLAI